MRLKLTVVIKNGCMTNELINILHFTTSHTDWLIVKVTQFIAFVSFGNPFITNMCKKRNLF